MGRFSAKPPARKKGRPRPSENANIEVPPKKTALPQRWLDSRELDGTERSGLTEGEGDTTGG